MSRRPSDNLGTLTAPPLVWRVVSVLAIVLVGLGVRISLAWQDARTLVIKTTPDDAYYYFQIARNLAHGNDVTFDGETVTNGFHPLWLVIITPIYWFTDDVLAVQVALTIGAVLGAATIGLIYLALHRLTDNHWASVLGAFFFALHPQIVTHAVSGLEAPVVMFMFALVAYLFLSMTIEPLAATTTADILFGCACGLMMLARTDTIFVVPPLVLYLCYRATPADRPRRLARWLIPMSAVLLPWVVWSIAATGSIVQVSGDASGWFNTEGWTRQNGDSLADKIPHGLYLAWEMLSSDLWHRFLIPHTLPTGPLLILLAVGAVAVWFMHKGEGATSTRTQLVLLGLLSLGVIAGLLFHAGYRWQMREWYYATSGVLCALWVGWGASIATAVLARVVARTSNEPDSRRSVLAMGALYGGMAVVLLVLMRPWSPHDWVFYAEVQENHLATARWIDENTEPDARVGSFNAGIIGYFSNRTVVNLDGVVNEDAFDALKECRVYQYILERDLDYMTDLISAVNGIGQCGAGDDSYELVATVGREIIWPDRGLLLVLRVTGAGAAETDQ